MVSSPKQGKSFLCQELALGVATGGKVLGLDVEAHEVLYLALEDTQQRVHDRLANMLQGAAAPEQLRFMFQWMRGNGSEFNSLRQWLEKHPGTRLIIIDTLVKFSTWKQNNYNADYQHISKFKAIADRPEQIPQSSWIASAFRVTPLSELLAEIWRMRKLP